MLYEAQFRSPAGSGQMLKAIEALDLPEQHSMEVCGTHTMAIAKSGLRQLLPPDPPDLRPRLSRVCDPGRCYG